MSDKGYKLRCRPPVATEEASNGNNNNENDVCKIVLNVDEKPKNGSVEIFDFGNELDDDDEEKRSRPPRRRARRKKFEPTKRSIKNMEALRKWLNSSTDPQNNNLPKYNPPTSHLVVLTPETNGTSFQNSEQTSQSTSQTNGHNSSAHVDDSLPQEDNCDVTQEMDTTPTSPEVINNDDVSVPHSSSQFKTPTCAGATKKAPNFNLLAGKSSTPAVEPVEKTREEMFGFEKFLDDKPAEEDDDDVMDMSPILMKGQSKKNKEEVRRSGRVLKIQHDRENKQIDKILFDTPPDGSDDQLQSNQESIDLFTDDYEWTKKNKLPKDEEEEATATTSSTTTTKKDTKQQQQKNLPAPSINFDEYYKHELVIENISP